MLLAKGVSAASFPVMCERNTREPDQFFYVGVNYFSCDARRNGKAVKIRSWVRPGGCVQLTTGSPIDCDYCLNSWVVSDEPADHQHDLQRTSKIFYARGSIWSDRQPPGEFFTSTGFSFRTGPSQPQVTFTAPEAAARVRVSISARLPQPSMWEFLCKPYDPWESFTCTDESRQEAYSDIDFSFLPPLKNWVKLEASTNYVRCDYFKKCQNQDSQGNEPHGSNMWGEAEFLELLKQLAENFRNYEDSTTGQQPFKHYKLRIGDISLKNGGVFDLNQDWSPPHCRHRVGRSADISRFVWDEQAKTLRELSPDQRDNFVKYVCKPLEGLSCSWEVNHFHVEYRSEGLLFPVNIFKMPCPWPSTVTHHDDCPITKVLPQ